MKETGYPFAAIDSLKEVLAKQEGVSVDHIHIGAGTSSLLCQTGLTIDLEGRSILSGLPTLSGITVGLVDSPINEFEEDNYWCWVNRLAA